MKKFLNSIRDFRKNHREDGNSFLLYIFLMPVLCGAIGLGIDTSLGQYVNAGIQASADSAVVAAAQKTQYSGNNRIINGTAAATTARDFYKTARLNYPAVTASSPTIRAEIVNTRGDRILRLTVAEKSPTVFMHILGVTELNHNIISEARLGASRQ